MVKWSGVALIVLGSIHIAAIGIEALPFAL